MRSDSTADSDLYRVSPGTSLWAPGGGGLYSERERGLSECVTGEALRDSEAVSRVSTKEHQVRSLCLTGTKIIALLPGTKAQILTPSQQQQTGYWYKSTNTEVHIRPAPTAGSHILLRIQLCVLILLYILLCPQTSTRTTICVDAGDGG